MLCCCLISGCRHLRHTPRRSVSYSLRAYFCSRSCAFDLTVILHLRHGTRIVLRVTTPPGRDFFSWLMRASAACCSRSAATSTPAPFRRRERRSGAVYIHNVNVLMVGLRPFGSQALSAAAFRISLSSPVAEDFTSCYLQPSVVASRAGVNASSSCAEFDCIVELVFFQSEQPHCVCHRIQAPFVYFGRRVCHSVSFSSSAI